MLPPRYEVDAEPVFDALDEAERRTLDVKESTLACPTWEAEMPRRSCCWGTAATRRRSARHPETATGRVRVRRTGSARCSRMPGMRVRSVPNRRQVGSQVESLEGGLAPSGGSRLRCCRRLLGRLQPDAALDRLVALADQLRGYCLGSRCCQSPSSVQSGAAGFDAAVGQSGQAGRIARAVQNGVGDGEETPVKSEMAWCRWTFLIDFSICSTLRDAVFTSISRCRSKSTQLADRVRRSEGAASSHRVSSRHSQSATPSTGTS